MRHAATHHGGELGTPRDHYAEVTNQIIAALEAGTPPWRKPWDNSKAGGPLTPENAVTGARYRGINLLTLGLSPFAFSTGDPRWATYKQAALCGWQVRKGSRGTTCFFYKRVEIGKPDSNDPEGGEEGKWIPLLRAFTLFHASQIEGIPPYSAPDTHDAPWRAPDALEIIVANSGAIIHIGGDRAFYSLSTDHIQMPPKAAFRSADGWASTLVHELCHFSAGAGRLNRILGATFGSEEYAREELRAEIGMLFVCSELGIVDCEWSNGTAYVADWLGILKGNKKEIFRAASDAQRIADYLLAFHPDYARITASGTTPKTSNDPDNEAVSDVGPSFARAA